MAARDKIVRRLKSPMILYRFKFSSLSKLRRFSDSTRASLSMDAGVHQPEELRIIPDVDAIFKQKKTVRTKVRKILKAMDPDLRAQEGIFRFKILNWILMLMFRTVDLLVLCR